MEKKTSKRSKIEYEPFNVKKALSVNEVNMLQINLQQTQAHNDGLQTQNDELQKDYYMMRKAIELMVIDVWVALAGKEPSDSDLKKEVDDYIKQSKELIKE